MMMIFKLKFEYLSFFIVVTVITCCRGATIVDIMKTENRIYTNSYHLQNIKFYN